MYQIKGLKTFRGHEGESCAQGSLYSPTGKKVATWSDDSWGGPMQIRFENRIEENAFRDFARTYLADKKDYEGKLYDVATMTDHDLVETALMTMSMVAQEDKELAKHTKKGLAYFLPDTSEPTGRALYVSKAPYTAANVAALRAKYPNLLEVVNERLGLPFVDKDAWEAEQRAKHLMKQCRTQILFVIKDAGGELKQMVRKTLYTKTQAADIRSRYPNLVEILNERFAALVN